MDRDVLDGEGEDGSSSWGVSAVMSAESRAASSVHFPQDAEMQQFEDNLAISARAVLDSAPSGGMATVAVAFRTEAVAVLHRQLQHFWKAEGHEQQRIRKTLDQFVRSYPDQLKDAVTSAASMSSLPPQQLQNLLTYMDKPATAAELCMMTIALPFGVPEVRACYRF
jgi:hypothetical protein